VRDDIAFVMMLAVLRARDDKRCLLAMLMPLYDDVYAMMRHAAARDAPL